MERRTGGPLSTFNSERHGLPSGLVDATDNRSSMLAPGRRGSARVGCVVGLIVLLGVTAVGLAAQTTAPGNGDVRRRFMPGPLGLEDGAPPPSPARFSYRTRAMTGVETGEAEVWAKENGLGPALAFSHNLATIFPPDLAATHPEFFPLVEGKRLVPDAGVINWNPDLGRPDVAAWTAAAARRYFKKTPRAPTFAAGVNDGLIFGDSPETLALITPPRWFRGRPDYSDLVFTFLNRAAADLRQTDPDKYLGALAYYWCEQVPTFPVHPQVIPFLTADRSQGYDAAWLAEERALQERWVRSGVRRIGLYDYLYGQGFLVPRITTKLIAENLRAARRLGFTEYYAEMLPNWGLDGPMPWLVAQLTQNPEGAVDVLLYEYYTRFFRDAAVPMRRFFERCEAQWMAQTGPAYWLKHYRNESQATLFPPEVCRELRGMLDAAGRAARGEPARSRVRLVADAFRVTEAFVEFQSARAELSRWLAAPERSAPAGREFLTQYLAARRRFVALVESVNRAATFAFAPVNLDDFVRNDPTWAAVMALGGVSAQLGDIVPDRDAREFLVARAGGRATELLTDGSLEGPGVAPRMIGGLAHGIGLPAGWVSRAEPTQAARAGLELGAARTGLQGLGISGAVNTTLFRWLPAKPGALYVAAVQARGLAKPGAAVTLLLGWLDAGQRNFGTAAVIRLPDGDWPDWMELQQAARAPAGAAWVGIGVRVQNQVAGDWAQFDDFSLKEVTEK